jgi:hypothetical protein
MADVAQTVLLNVTVNDTASKALKTVYSAASRVTGVFDTASSALGHFGLAAGAMAAGFGLKEAFSDTIEHLKAVKRIGDLTEITASKSEALINVFDRVGISMAESERILMSISKKGSKLDMIMAATGKSTNTTGVMLAQMGVNMKQGPVVAMEQIAEGIKGGRIHAVQLANAFSMPVKNAMLLEKALKKGKSAITDAQKEQIKYGIAGDENMKMLARYVNAQRGMKEGWERIKLQIGAALMPLVTKLMEYGEKNMDKWVDSAKHFAGVLTSFLTRFHDKLLSVGKIMLLNFTISKLTGKSIAGWMPTLLQGGKFIVGKLATKAAAPAMAGAGTMAKGGAAAAFSAMFPKFIATAGGGAGGAAASAGLVATITAAAAPILVIVAAIAAVVLAIWATWKAYSQNINGVTTRFREIWNRISVHFDAISNQIAKTFKPITNMFNKVFAKSGGVGKFFITIIPNMINDWLSLLEKALFYIRVGQRFFDNMISLISDVASSMAAPFIDAWNVAQRFGAGLKSFFNAGVSLFSQMFDDIKTSAQSLADFALALIKQHFAPLISLNNAIRDLFMKILDYIRPIGKFIGSVVSVPTEVFKFSAAQIEAETQMALLQQARDDALKRKGTKAPDDRAGTTNNFPDARFNITQKFAEGFDPDRIAIAFSRDVAAMGERKLQSGFSPVFGV